MRKRKKELAWMACSLFLAILTCRKCIRSSFHALQQAKGRKQGGRVGKTSLRNYIILKGANINLQQFFVQLALFLDEF